MPKKLEFVDFKKSLKYYQWRVKSRTEKIKKYKEMNSPKIIIENEEKLLQKDKDNLALNRVAVYMYNKGFESGKQFAEMERLKNVLFKKPYGKDKKPFNNTNNTNANKNTFRNKNWRPNKQYGQFRKPQYSK